MISFSLPRLTADRLARLVLACASDSSALGHIAVRIAPDAVRFSTTNGRILASLLSRPEDVLGSGDLVLDRDQFAAALKAAAKGTGRVQFQIDEAEARISTTTTVALVRRLPLTFPVVDHVWSRPTGKRWVPAISSLDSGLVAIAQKVSGLKPPLLFSSPVEPAHRLDRLWAVPGAQADESLSVRELRQAVSAPAYWADHELAILIMPITRSDGERQLSLGQHALAIPAPASARAAGAVRAVAA